MTTYVFANLVVTNAVAANLRELSRRIDKGDCDGMFLSPLSASGNLPATRWLSTGMIPAPYWNAVTNDVRLFNVGKKAWEDDGDVFPFTQTQVNNAMAQCTITNGTFNGQPESPQEMIARLGLKPVGGVA